MSIYAVLKEVEPKQITCSLQIERTTDFAGMYVYGYCRAPNGATQLTQVAQGNLTPNVIGNNICARFTATGTNIWIVIGRNERVKEVILSGTSLGNQYIYDLPDSDFEVELPAIGVRVNVGKSYNYIDSANDNMLLKKDISQEDKTKIFQYFKNNLGKSISINIKEI